MEVGLTRLLQRLIEESPPQLGVVASAEAVREDGVFTYIAGTFKGYPVVVKIYATPPADVAVAETALRELRNAVRGFDGGSSHD